TRLAPDATFRSLVRQTRDRALAAFAHAAVPFEHVVASVAPERDPARTPLVQALFILHSKDGASQVARVQGNRELHNGSSKFELSVVFAETDGQLEGMFEYATDLFDLETVERLGRSFVTLLDAAAARPEEPLDRLPVLAAPDAQRVLRDWNATHVEAERGSLTLPELFERQAARTPDATALVFGGESLTYAELDRRATQLAHHLVRLGAAPDVLVGLQVERSVDLVVGLLGILKAGAAYVPLDPSFPPARLAHMVEHSRMAILVSHRDLANRLPVRPPVVVRLDDDAERIAEAAATPGAPRANARHLAYVLYTSGSTGTPKGVGVEHAAIVNFLLSMEKEPGLDASDTLLAITTLSFDIAGLEIYLPLVTGAKVVLATRADAVDPSRLAALLRDSGATVLQATPATWRALVESGWPGAANLKALCGGEALPPELARALLARVRELWNMYGPTETTVWSTLHRMQAADVGAPIGKPIANTDVYVLDVHLQPVAVGAVGELYIGGRGLARGYLHAGALTAERFVQHPFVPGARLYRTGDLARWRGDGELECLGRTDHQVKLRGYRIELGEIESALLAHETVQQAVVVAREDRPGDKRLVAYVVAPGAAPDLAEQLRARLRSALPEYMLPARTVLLDALPLTPNGKVDRRALPAPDANEDPGPAPEHEEPPSEVALALVVVWRRVLGVERVGVRDSFFELGGNSLTALQLLVEMKRATGIDVNVGTLFRWSTIEQLLAAVGSGATQEGALVVPLQADGDGRPLFCLCGISLYQQLAPHLGRAAAVYGVFAPEEDTLSERALRGASLELAIEQLARAQYEAIVRVAPRGPYRLAGSSFGGIIAIEVASMMRRAGAEVEVVLLLDTLSPQAIHVNRWAWAKRRVEQVFTGEAFGRVKRDLLRFKDRMVAKGLLAGERTAEDLAREAWDAKQRAFFAAVAKWKGGSLRDDFRVVLFRASEQAWGVQHELLDDYGWRHYLRPPVEIVPVKGTHLGILENPEAEALGQRIQEALARS
ncbi:MAG TPA: amino acid adenylation domain-containing protein, partial [Polyangiaceae bacterium]